jgi:hypothetical protein
LLRSGLWLRKALLRALLQALLLPAAGHVGRKPVLLQALLQVLLLRSQLWLQHRLRLWL